MLGATLRAAGGLAFAALLFTFGQTLFQPLLVQLETFVGSDSQIIRFARATIRYLPLVALLGTAVDFIARGVLESRLPG